MFNALRDYVENNTEKEYWIVVQTHKDRELSEKSLRSVSADVRVHLIEDHDPLALREVYKRMDVVVTMRLHAGILALSSLIPVIGVFCSDWGLKNPGIMDAFGMPYIMSDLGDEKIEDLVKQIPEDAASRIEERIENFRDVLSFN